MSSFKYFVLISIENERECAYYDSLTEAIERYKATPMHKLKDNVFLGIESKEKSPMDKDFMCFDVLHKFFEDNVLIDDYKNHLEEGVLEIVKQIVNEFYIKYQYSYDLLKGVLIPYASDYVHSTLEETMDEKWNEAYITTLKNNDMVAVGWQPPTRETLDKYGWFYPNNASYIDRINVRYTDSSGAIHDRDVDVREYLAYHGKRFTDCKEMR